MNLPPEDVFVAVNDMGVQQGYGYVMYQYQPSVYPDKPVNIFFDMDCTAEAEYLIFGALVARARALRNQNTNEGARMYTSAGPSSARKMDFLTHNGFRSDNSEDLVRLQIPREVGAEMFNCTISALPLNSQQDMINLAERLRRYGLAHITLPHLQALQTNPLFQVWGLTYGNTLVGECIISGRVDAAELVGIYTVPEHQRRGMAKYLLRRALSLVGQEGVPEVRARIMSASKPQVSLVRNFGAELIDQTLMFPAMDL